MTASTSTPSSSGGGGKGIGIVLALIVFVILLFVVIGRNDTNTKVGVKELKVEKVDKSTVDKIEVTLPPKKPAGNAAADAADAGPAADAGEARHVVLEKKDGAWLVYDGKTPDKKFAADESQVKTALDAIGEFATGDLIANKKEKHADLEIDDDKGLAVKITAKGKTALDLLFGRAAKGGGSTVRVKGSDDVFVAKGRLGAIVKKEVTAWRKKTLFDLKADDVTRVSIKNADGTTLTLQGTPPPAAAPDAGPHAPKAEWQLVEPATLPDGFRLDKAQLARPASAFASLRAQDFADGASDATGGFDQPHTVVEATTSKGKIVLHLGKEDDKKRIYAKVDGDPQMYLLAAYSAKQLQKTLDDLRELTLFTATADEVEKVTWKGANGTVVVQKKGEEWTLVEPKAPPPEFEASQIASQVAGVLRTRAARVDTSAPASAVAKPTTTIEVQLKGGKKQSLRFGDSVDGDKKEFWVKGAADDLTYVIAAFTKNRFDKPIELFKKPPTPPGGMGGGMQGLENLPPDVRKKLEESIRKGDLPAGHP